MIESSICPISFIDQEEYDVECTIPGKPFAKQRPKASRRGKFISVYTPKETVDYENLVKYSYYSQNGDNMLQGPLAAEIVGTFPIPKSASKKQVQLMLDGEIKHTKKPDCDNMAKVVLDALNGIAFEDDSQVVELSIKKEYGLNPKTQIKLRRLIKE